MTVLVLGDQLTRRGPLADSDERVLMIESHSFARRLPYHPHKLALVFAAMRAFRDELEATGREVVYLECETFEAGFRSYFERHPGDELVLMRPPSDGAESRLRTLVEDAGGVLTAVDNELFLCSREAFAGWVAGRSRPYRHERFYRFMRRETGYLMDGDEPVGGQWNYDDENRQFPGADHEPPAPPRYEPDEQTREVVRWVRETFDGGYDEPPYGGGWADPEEFCWPVTRTQALDALDRFVAERLPTFGPYQDAMLEGEWAMHHSLLSAALNLGLLHPAEAIEAALEARDDPDVALSSVEGFVRQLLGWREFVRGVYRETMPGLADANQLAATEALPELYWHGQTQMACLVDAVDGVRKRGYSHHIQRLMVLSNFALVYGVEPAALNRWFHAGYVDAFHWVTTPNVVEMGLYGAGAFATKPYAASANYIDRMSDHCGDCRYDPDATTGADACPFNALYWEFLDRNEDHLADNHRMALMYSHLGNKDREAIGERADRIRALARQDKL